MPVIVSSCFYSSRKNIFFVVKYPKKMGAKWKITPNKTDCQLYKVYGEIWERNTFHQTKLFANWRKVQVAITKPECTQKSVCQIKSAGWNNQAKLHWTKLFAHFKVHGEISNKNLQFFNINNLIPTWKCKVNS